MQLSTNRLTTRIVAKSQKEVTNESTQYQSSIIKYKSVGQSMGTLPLPCYYPGLKTVNGYP